MVKNGVSLNVNSIQSADRDQNVTCALLISSSYIFYSVLNKLLYSRTVSCHLNINVESHVI